MAELTIQDRYDIIPEVDGNAKRTDPIIAHCKVLTPGEREDCMEYSTNEEGDVRVDIDRRKLFLNSVESIENCNVNGKTINNAREFMRTPGLSAYYDDICLQIIPHVNATVVSKN